MRELNRRGLALLAGLLALAVTVATGVLYWRGRPIAQVPMPSANASPAQTVATYVRALNARDFATSNALTSSMPAAQNHWWDLDHDYFDDLVFEEESRELPPGDKESHGLNGWATVVVVTTDTTPHLDGHDLGHLPWAFFLGRNSHEDPWQIIQWGQP